ncbi:MAG: autotransporter assembly complex protein TamA, partial [Bacillota bacterium]
MRPLAFLLACAASTAALAKDPAPLPVTWEGPEPLRTELRKLLPPPTPDTGLSRRASLRPWVRDVRRRVPEIAAAEGYFSATVEVELSEDEGGGARVVVNPGPRTTVASVDIEFSGDIAGPGEARESRRQQLTNSWALHQGEPFRSADWEEAKRGLQERLVEEDYAGGRIASSEARVDADKAQAQLLVKIDSGPPYTFGQVSVEGLSHYPLSVVSRVNDIKPGDPYRQERLLALQRALQNGPWFSSVVVDIEREPGRNEQVPVKVTVIERPRKEIGLAAGYGTDAGIRGEVAFRHRDLFGRGFDLQSAIRADRKQQIGYADVFLPQKLWPSWFGELPTKDSVGVLAEHTDIEGLETRRAAVAGYRQFTIEPGELRMGLSYQVERASPEGATAQVTRALAPVVALTWRHVDDVFDPTRGGVLNLQLAAGSTALLSTRDFVKTYGQFQLWIPLGSKDQVLLRTEVGYTFAKTRAGIP